MRLPRAGRRRFLAMLPVLGAGLPGRAAAPPGLEPLRDLRADARLAKSRREPIVVLFSLPGCPFCEAVRRSHLLPLLRDPAQGASVIIRQVDIDSEDPVTGFRGERTTHAALARAHGVRAVPVVAFWGPDGASLADPLSGMLLPDFYGAYLEDSLAKARKRLSGAA